MSSSRLPKWLLLALLLIAPAAAFAQPGAPDTIPFPHVGSIWRHCSNSLDGVDWTNPSYDDSAAPWFEGPGLLSNDTGNAAIAPMIQTVIVGPPVSVDGGPPQHSYYFRKKFTVAGPIVPSVLRFVGRIDDGIIILLNGNPIYHLRITNGTPLVYASSDFATGYACGGDPDCGDDVFDAPAIGLTEGENVLAVILMQEGTGSSDVTFGLGISEILPATAPTITDSTEPRDRIAPQNQTVRLLAIATGVPSPDYQWYKDGVPIEGATGTNYTIQSMQPGDAGLYFCRVSNFAGSVDTRTASLQFTDDTFPPTVVNIVPASSSSIIVEFNEAMLGASGGGLFTEDPFSYILAGGTMGSGILGVVLNSGGFSVTLTVSPDLEPDTDYTLDLSGDISDLAGNRIVPIVVPFRSWVPVASPGIMFEVFDTTDAPGGNSVASLTSHPSYPNRPQEIATISGFDSRVLYPTDGKEQYGARMRGLFIPPSTGSWIFYLWADDGSQLFVNPTGAGASGKQLLLDRTACCGDFNSANSRSAPQNLMAGRAYYVEALYKEGTGGDYGKVIALREGQPVPGTGDAGLAAPVAAPLGVAGTFTINQPPADQTVTPNTAVTFSVGTTTDVPLSYQWLRDGVEIPNAVGAPSIGSQYHLTVTEADDGARFSVRVSILGGPTITSSEALLTVGADTTPPTVVRVVTDAAGASLTVTFSEAMGPSAADPANYTINGVAASSATLTSPTVVTVVPASPLQGGGCTLHEVRISGVSDQASVPNLVSPNPTIVSLSSPQLIILPLGAVWKYLDDGSDQGTAWREVGFNDTAWPSGPAPLGFEPGTPQVPVVATPISDVTTNKTAYFRTHFNLSVAPSGVLLLQLNEIVDDGAVYYLNGVETHRSYMPAAPAVIDASTLATGSGPEPVNGTHTVVAVNISKTGLVAGDNVLAVELHPNSLTSSDSEFAAQLNIVLCTPNLAIERVGSQVRLTWSDAGYRLETAPAPTGPWTSQAGGSGLLLNASAGNAFFRLAAP